MDTYVTISKNIYHLCSCPNKKRRGCPNTPTYIINASIGPYHGKGASEQTLLRNMLGTFKAGDVVLADAFYSTYFLIAHMIANGIDIVFMQHGARSRTTNFDTGLKRKRGQAGFLNFGKYILIYITTQ